MAEPLDEFPIPERPYILVALDGADHYLPIDKWPEQMAAEVRELLEAGDPREAGE